jgi:hypothetical protein
VNIQLRAFHGKLQGRKTWNTSLRIQCSWVVRDVKMFDTTGINLNKSQHFQCKLCIGYRGMLLLPNWVAFSNISQT